MKANELMIGDWVQSTFMGNKVPCRVVGISTDITIEYQNCARKYEALKDVEPIPLAIEILEKNGWWLGDAEHHLESLNATIKLDYYFGNDFTIRYDSDKKLLIERGYDNGEMELQYVHELQHALKLYGIDKNIEL